MKKRSRRSNPQRREYWTELMRRWREGGQAVRTFCRAESVRESAFYFWRRELARRASQVVGNGMPAKAKSRPAERPLSQAPRPHGSTPSFLPVRVVTPHMAQVPSGVEIVLEQGRRVRVSAGFDRQTLADVLAVLEVRPC